MSEHEVSRVFQAPTADVFAVVGDIHRLPEWLSTVRAADQTGPGSDTDVHVEGDAGAGGYVSEGFWRPSADQLRVEWGTPSRGSEESYAGWLQVEDRTSGCEVVVHLSFFGAQPPPGVESALASSLEALADLVER